MTLIAKRWRFTIAWLLLLSFMIPLLLLPSLAATADCEDGEPVADRFATCQFTHTTNASLGLNATLWFQRPFNNSNWWAAFGNLTWAFDPNLAFWSYFWTGLTQITAAVSPEIAVEYIGWGIPVRDSLHPEATYPGGDIIDYNNDSYYPTIFYLHPEAVDNPGAPLENLTFDLAIEGVQVLPPEYWRARIYWDKTGLSDGQWTALADQLEAQLNATWYMKSCTFDKKQPECDDASWPFDAVFFGLLVLLGIGYKRKRRYTKELRS